MKLWIRLDVAIASDPNVAELASRLEIPFAEAVGLCTLVWCAIAEHRPNGDMSGISISAIESWGRFNPRKGKPSGSFGRAFLSLFVYDDAASGWHDRQGKLVERAEKERLRKRRGRSAEGGGNSAPTERNGTERNGTVVVPEQLKDQSGEEGAVGAADFSSNGTPPRVVLPREADKFLAQFYEPVGGEGSSTRRRYTDVRGQLYDVLDPLHPGPKIRGGLRVKARSVEHLTGELKAVMQDPPPDRDLAIVWLLKRLTNPVKGPSESEQHKYRETQSRQTEERYSRAAKEAGVQWANKHPEEYEPIRKSVEANFRDAKGTWVEVGKQAELIQRCAKAAGFPVFEEWVAQKGDVEAIA